MSTPQLLSFQELYSRIGVHLEEGMDPLLSVAHEDKYHGYLGALADNHPNLYSHPSTKSHAILRGNETQAAWEILKSPKEIIRYQAVLTWQAVEKLRANGGSQQEIDGLKEQLAKQVAKWDLHYPNEVRAVALEMHNSDGTPRFTEAALHPEGAAPAASTHDEVIDVQATEVPPAPTEHVELSDDNLTAAESATPAVDAVPAGSSTTPPETTPEKPPAEPSAAAEPPAAAPVAEPAKPPVSESRALTLVESTAEKTAAAEAKSHTKTGMIIAAIVGAVGIGAAAWRNREKPREAETSRTR